MRKRLQIVSFNVPLPANYGGIIDVFYRIKTLAAMGVDIQLHAFTYGRAVAPELEKYCSKVTYYKRNTSFVNAVKKIPYIVASRANRQLDYNLSQCDAPILLEGLHCCACLDGLDGHRVFVRAHNVEHDYYRRLAESERDPLKKLYFISEAKKLKHYENQLLKADCILSVTETDSQHFRSIGCPNVLLMPSSHANNEVVSKTGRGGYALYHADLSVAENIKAVHFIVEQLLAHTDHRLIVAGRNPAVRLRQFLSQFSNVTLVANPDDETMHRLIVDAQLCILFTDQPTGLKLKLLTSLYAGRHCVVNSNMVYGTRLGTLCAVADSAFELRALIDRAMRTPFTESDIEMRKEILSTLYSNEANAQLLYEML